MKIIIKQRNCCHMKGFFLVILKAYKFCLWRTRSTWKYVLKQKSIHYEQITNILHNGIIIQKSLSALVHFSRTNFWYQLIQLRSYRDDGNNRVDICRIVIKVASPIETKEIYHDGSMIPNIPGILITTSS